MDTKRSAVTLVEILIVCVIISITVGLATAGFRTLVEQERQNVCDYNQLILYKAMQLYASDHDVYPSSLSSLVPGYATQALACLKAEKAFPPRVIALRVLQWFEPQEAVAQSLRNYYGGDVRVITCPADTTPPPGRSFVRAESDGNK
jgi:competence protein ComGC